MIYDCGKDTVVQVQLINDKGFWRKETYFLIGTYEEKAKFLNNVVFKRKWKTNSSSRKVLYV